MSKMNAATLLIFVVGLSVTASKVLNGSVFRQRSVELYSTEDQVVGAFVISNAEKSDGKIYTIHADVNDNRREKGVYEVDLNLNTTVKILDKGRDLCYDDDSTIYVASNDGIYVYKTGDKSFKKYGTFKADVISLTKMNGSDLFYAVTNDNKAYKVTENGNKYVLDDKLKAVKQVMFDNFNVLHYVTLDNEVFKVKETMEKIDFNVKIDYVRLLKSSATEDDALFLLVNNDLVVIKSTGILKVVENLGKVSAFSKETDSLLIYAVDKKVYGFIPLLYVIGSFADVLSLKY
uniref:Uncharacterized protein n=1 Tax=Bombyx mori TaxID=7091 RepID=A0A8R2ARY0_BOMMO|nr:uncharacterized protein LOC101742472 [Bombyx mori]